MEASGLSCLRYCLLACLGFIVDGKVSSNQSALEPSVAILYGDLVGKSPHRGGYPPPLLHLYMCCSKVIVQATFTHIHPPSVR
jgi:hypothetical protein